MALSTSRGGGADQASLGFLTNRGPEIRLPRATRVKNKTPAGVQSTAEQILREARERQEPEIHPPKQRITDAHELGDYRLCERKRFEDLIIRGGVPAWVKYARWEEGQGDLALARFVYERALDLDVARRDHTPWIKYAEFEMRKQCAVSTTEERLGPCPLAPPPRRPAVELLGALANARLLFERWMGWRPDIATWNSYIKFELRYGRLDLLCPSLDLHRPELHSMALLRQTPSNLAMAK